MKREELEANGEEGTKYKKEPSPCPICGKVSRLYSTKYDWKHVKNMHEIIEETCVEYFSTVMFVCTGVLLQE